MKTDVEIDWTMTDSSTWVSEDGRFEIIEKEGLYLLRDRTRYAGIHASFGAAEGTAKKRIW